MRNLTQQEIDNAPEWSTHYFIYADAAIVENETHFMDLSIGLKLRNEGVGMSSEAKPIPRKEFDISDCKLSGEIRVIDYDELCVTLSERDQEIDVGRLDAIALAKHFKLTAEDLK